MSRVTICEACNLPISQGCGLHPRNYPTRTVTTSCLAWQEGRWHVDGRGIHAGDVLELHLDNDTWRAVRIESKDCGRILTAHFYLDPPLDRFLATSRINVVEDELRWPLKGAR